MLTAIGSAYIHGIVKYEPQDDIETSLSRTEIDGEIKQLGFVPDDSQDCLPIEPDLDVKEEYNCYPQVKEEKNIVTRVASPVSLDTTPLITTHVSVTASEDGKRNVLPFDVDKDITKGNLDESSIEYKCQQCDYNATKKRNLGYHMRAHHGLKEFKCKQCSFTTKWKSNLGKHTKGFHGSEKFICYHCNFSTKWKPNLIEHIQSFHCSKNCVRQQYNCINRGKSNLIRYEAGCCGKDFECRICSFTTNRKLELVDHVKEYHSVTECYKCERCSFTCKLRQHLTKHLNRRHGVEQFRCQQCNYATKAKRYLSRHVKRHHCLGKFKCQQCNFVTHTNRYLVRHVKRSHA
ncbi:hypothetical protein PPYR_13417 [Photinus pyralis]|uniref:C2H2-type domain-containing protein n=1 Tax=Photinus pyralis TaxID=7054 RepID=A0A1Y1LI43_PHOPY|nr:hypothetical protein PPYR_13417 [Photinus pyralis]